ncbi:AraC family transcriptional regulator [Mucilaginibacter sp. BJC16-A38]|uniref:helix-turn-helix domain-containing protein n=1 Tax=Mucilaginibacter phenanthrenivorans TaxID=1234842 RepID=UPI002157DD88|nr:AraC family transcriptional regulator [Mucilaginibacter phenanthrenivorans]MCR8561831.1 AraC family transcriptional regulator [Mucilaginibacter phenanthrenivorans]
MTVHFNLFNIIVLLGALQGLILSVMLLFPWQDKRQNKYFLAAFMLMLVYDSFGTFCWSSGFNLGWLAYFDAIFPYAVVFTAGPSLYLYIQTTITPGKIPGKVIFRAYLPVLIDAAFRICLLTYAVLYKRSFSLKVTPGQIDAIYQPIAEVLMVVVFWIYLLAAIRQFKKRETETPGITVSAITEQTLISKWTKVLLTAMTLIATVWTATIFGSLLFNIEGIAYFSPIEIILVIFTYWIGLKGYQHTRVVYISDQKANKTYADTLPAEEIQHYVILVKKAMEIDKLYLDPELTVNKLATRLEIPSRIISAVLNRELKKGFSEFVNEYRINEVKLMMLQPENSHITIAGIAFEAGFNSVATFQRTFKNLEQITPKQFLSAYKNRDKIMLKT